MTLGYRVANDSQGTDWMLLESGVTLRKPAENQTMSRESFPVKLPDGSMVPLASTRDYQEDGHLRGLNTRANAVGESINYFPAEVNQPCRMLFFTDPADQRAMPFDQFDLSWQRGCVGRLFFKLPEGTTIEPGKHWLVVSFAGSTIEVPFRIVTEEEEKFLKKNWKDVKKEHEACLEAEAEKAQQQ